MTSATGLVQVDGAALEYQWINQSGKRSPALILLHEALGCVAMWKGLPRALAASTDCSVLSFSRQGHGRSAPLTAKRDDGYLHHEALSVLPSVLQATGVGEAVLFGHSDGASIALIYAATRPVGLRGIILEAPHVMVEDVTLAGIRAAMTVSRTGDWWDKLRRYHGANTDTVFHAWHDTWLRPAFGNWNIQHLLPDIHCPVLIVQGEDDEYATRQQVDAIARGVSGPVTVMMLPDCGHIPHRDQQAIVVDAASRFVRAIDDSPRPETTGPRHQPDM